MKCPLYCLKNHQGEWNQHIHANFMFVITGNNLHNIWSRTKNYRRNKMVDYTCGSPSRNCSFDHIYTYIMEGKNNIMSIIKKT
jgi:hypothetical protein